jgi:hypothetical protein
MVPNIGKPYKEKYKGERHSVSVRKDFIEREEEGGEDKREGERKTQKNDQ